MTIKIHVDENADEDCIEKIKTSNNSHGSIRTSDNLITQDILNNNRYKICLKCWTDIIKRDYE